MSDIKERILKILESGAMRSSELSTMTCKTPRQLGQILSKMEGEKLVASRCDTHTREKIWFKPKEITPADHYYATVDNTDAVEELTEVIRKLLMKV